MATFIVDRLEVIKIEQDQHRRGSGLGILGQRLFKATLETTPIEQTGQRIVLGFPALQGLLLTTLGNILDHADKTQWLVGSHNLTGMHLYPQGNAISMQEAQLAN